MPSVSLKNKNSTIISASVAVPKAKPEVNLPKEKGPDYTPISNPERLFYQNIRGKKVLIQTSLGEEIQGIFNQESKFNLFVTVSGIERCIMKHGIIQIIPSNPEEKQ